MKPYAEGGFGGGGGGGGCRGGKVEREEGEEVGKVPLAPVSLETTLCDLCPHAPIIILRDPRSPYVGIYSDVLGGPQWRGGKCNSWAAPCCFLEGLYLDITHRITERHHEVDYIPSADQTSAVSSGCKQREQRKIVDPACWS